jgi:hypothetical protein
MHSKATLLCGPRTFNYSHTKCATFTKIAVKSKKSEFESEKLTEYSEYSVDLEYIYIYTYSKGTF